MDKGVKSSLVHHSSFDFLLRRLVFESPKVSNIHFDIDTKDNVELSLACYLLLCLGKGFLCREDIMYNTVRFCRRNSDHRIQLESSRSIYRFCSEVLE